MAKQTSNKGKKASQVRKTMQDVLPQKFAPGATNKAEALQRRLGNQGAAEYLSAAAVREKLVQEKPAQEKYAAASQADAAKASPAGPRRQSERGAKQSQANREGQRKKVES